MPCSAKAWISSPTRCAMRTAGTLNARWPRLSETLSCSVGVQSKRQADGSWPECVGVLLRRHGAVGLSEGVVVHRMRIKQVVAEGRQLPPAEVHARPHRGEARRG